MSGPGGGASIHGTCIAVGGHGVLLFGAPGSGKSDLALRLIDTDGRGTGPERLTAQLVADDQVVLAARGGRLIARAPDALAGRLEVRGLGIVSVAYLEEVPVLCAARLDGTAAPERLPDFSQRTATLCGIAIPELALDARAPSAPAVIRAAVIAFAGAGRQGFGTA